MSFHASPSLARSTTLCSPLLARSTSLVLNLCRSPLARSTSLASTRPRTHRRSTAHLFTPHQAPADDPRLFSIPVPACLDNATPRNPACLIQAAPCRNDLPTPRLTSSIRRIWIVPGHVCARHATSTSRAHSRRVNIDNPWHNRACLALPFRLVRSRRVITGHALSTGHIRSNAGLLHVMSHLATSTCQAPSACVSTQARTSLTGRA